MGIKALLIVTACIEVGAGFALLGVPAWTVEVLVGEGLSSPGALLVARIAGAALVAIGVACWLGRNGARPAQSGLVGAILIYNLAVPILLLHGWFVAALAGPGLWPGSVLHSALALWCLACLGRNR